LGSGDANPQWVVQNDLDRGNAPHSVPSQPTTKSRFELLEEFSGQTAPLFKDGRTGNELIIDLYDEETGLPK
jgi:hypothetical protein